METPITPQQFLEPTALKRTSFTFDCDDLNRALSVPLWAYYANVSFTEPIDHQKNTWLRFDRSDHLVYGLGISFSGYYISTKYSKKNTYDIQNVDEV